MQKSSTGAVLPPSWLKKPSQLQTFLLSVMTRGHIWQPPDEGQQTDDEEEADDPNSSHQQNQQSSSLLSNNNNDDDDAEEEESEFSNDDEVRRSKKRKAENPSPDDLAETSYEIMSNDVVDDDDGDDDRSLSSFAMANVKPEVRQQRQQRRGCLSDAAEKRRIHLDAVIRAATDSAIWSKLPPARPDRHRKFETQYKLQAIEYAKVYGNVAASRVYDVDGKSIREWRIREEHLKSIQDMPNGYQRCRLLGGGRRKKFKSKYEIYDKEDYDETVGGASSSTSVAMATADHNDDDEDESYGNEQLSKSLPVAHDADGIAESPPPATVALSTGNRQRPGASSALRDYRKMDWRKCASSSAKKSAKRIIPEPRVALGSHRSMMLSASGGKRSSGGNYEILSTNSFEVADYDDSPEEGETERAVLENGDSGATKQSVVAEQQKSFWNFSSVKKQNEIQSQFE